MENKGKSISIESTLNRADDIIELIEKEYLTKNQDELQEDPDSGYEFITAVVSVLPFHYISSMGGYTADELKEVEEAHLDLVKGFYRDVAPVLIPRSEEE